MKLSEALAVIRKTPEDASTFAVSLACGFTPLHLTSFLRAHLQRLLPERKVDVTVGLYDDLLGSVGSWESANHGVGVLILEWPDLDARLGFRALGGWGQTFVPSIVENVRTRLRHLASLLSTTGSMTRIIVVPPTLPLPPFFHTVSSQSSEAELGLRAELTHFLRDIAAHPSVVIAAESQLDALSSRGDRYDLRSDLNAGFPYTLRHADTIGQTVAALLQPAPPKKGLITDLDDTFWLGLVGEIGAAAVCWDLSNHAQVHGLYQQMLRALADQGVLLAVASKNSPELAGEALTREDLGIPKEKLFPLEIHWEPKSHSVARILKTWNIAANSVVFIDDSPIELEEVKLAHPDVECRLFPKSDPAQVLKLLEELRDLFGKPRLSEEDSFRLESLRSASAFSETATSPGSTETLLANAGASMHIDFAPPLTDVRLQELVNKTNQFNLNGLRLDDAEWARRRNDPSCLTVSIQYSDQFGPLGKIAVLQADRSGSQIKVHTWVVSCRAFSRRIEYQTLKQLFDFSGTDSIAFDFRVTPKNAPVSQFFTGLLGYAPDGFCTLTRESFEEQCPPLYHKVTLKK